MISCILHEVDVTSIFKHFKLENSAKTVFFSNSSCCKECTSFNAAELKMVPLGFVEKLENSTCQN